MSHESHGRTIVHLAHSAARGSRRARPSPSCRPCHQPRHRSTRRSRASRRATARPDGLTRAPCGKSIAAPPLVAEPWLRLPTTGAAIARSVCRFVRFLHKSIPRLEDRDGRLWSTAACDGIFWRRWHALLVCWTNAATQAVAERIGCRTRASQYCRSCAWHSDDSVPRQSLSRRRRQHPVSQRRGARAR